MCRTFWFLIAVCCAAPAVLAAAPAAGAEPAAIANPAEPPAREHWTLREAWRQGGDDDDGILLGQVGAAVSGPGGEVYALDSQLAQILVFDASGSLLRTLGREGEGPGEFRQPTALGLTADGCAAVQQTFPGRLIYLDRQTGEPRGEWSLGKSDPQSGGIGLLLATRERGGVRAVAAANNTVDMAAGAMRGLRYLALLDGDGQERHRLAELSSTQRFDRQVRDELAEHFAGDRGLWEVGPDGHVYLVPRFDEYRIDVYNRDGVHVRTITRDHTARLRSEEEKAEQRASMQMNVGGREVEIDWKQQDRARCVERLQVLDDGSLWVSNSYGGVRWPEHGERSYDVYDAGGRLQREVTVTVPEGGKGHRLVLMDDGRFLLIKGLESLSLSIGASSTGTTSTVRQDNPTDAAHELVCFEPRR